MFKVLRERNLARRSNNSFLLRFYLHLLNETIYKCIGLNDMKKMAIRKVTAVLDPAIERAIEKTFYFDRDDFRPSEHYLANAFRHYLRLKALEETAPHLSKDHVTDAMHPGRFKSYTSEELDNAKNETACRDNFNPEGTPIDPNIKIDENEEPDNIVKFRSNRTDGNEKILESFRLKLDGDSPTKNS